MHEILHVENWATLQTCHEARARKARKARKASQQHAANSKAPQLKVEVASTPCFSSYLKLDCSSRKSSFQQIHLGIVIHQQFHGVFHGVFPLLVRTFWAQTLEGPPVCDDLVQLLQRERTDHPRGGDLKSQAETPSDFPMKIMGQNHTNGLKRCPNFFQCSNQPIL